MWGHVPVISDVWALSVLGAAVVALVMLPPRRKRARTARRAAVAEPAGPV